MVSSGISRICYTVHLHSLAYEVATALKFCRNVIKHSRSCRPRALGSTNNAEAARDIQTSDSFFSKSIGKKLPNLYQSLGIIKGLLSAPRRMLRKLWFDAQGLLEWFSNRCSVLKNGEAESFRRVPVGSHSGAG